MVRFRRDRSVDVFLEFLQQVVELGWQGLHPGLYRGLEQRLLEHGERIVYGGWERVALGFQSADPQSNYEVVCRNVPGPDAISKPVRAEYYRRLGIALPKANEDWFVGYLEFAGVQEARQAQRMGAPILSNSRNVFCK